MTVIDKLIVEIDSDTSGFERGVSRVMKKTDELDRIFERIKATRAKGISDREEIDKKHSSALAGLAIKVGVYTAGVALAAKAWNSVNDTMKDIEANAGSLLKKGLITDEEVARAKEWNRSVSDGWSTLSRFGKNVAGTAAGAMGAIDRDVEGGRLVGKDSYYRRGLDGIMNSIWGGDSRAGLTAEQTSEFARRRAAAQPVEDAFQAEQAAAKDSKIFGPITEATSKITKALQNGLVAAAVGIKQGENAFSGAVGQDIMSKLFRTSKSSGGGGASGGEAFGMLSNSGNSAVLGNTAAGYSALRSGFAHDLQKQQLDQLQAQTKLLQEIADQDAPPTDGALVDDNLNLG